MEAPFLRDSDCDVSGGKPRIKRRVEGDLGREVQPK